jgi:lysophospholipase L1-like esterase
MPTPLTPAPRETLDGKTHRKRLLNLALSGLLLISLVGIYQYLSSARPIGLGPAGPAVDATAFAGTWTSRPVLVVGLGDSVTAEFGARRNYSYFDRLLSNPEDEYGPMRGVNLRAVFPALQATNLAVSGSVSHELIGYQLPGLRMSGSNTLGWVVITTGGNDLIHNYGKSPPREQAMYGATWEQAQPWITGFEGRLEKIIADVTALFPGGCHIFLGNIYDPTDGVGDIQRAGLPAWPDGLKIHAAYNDTIRRCSEKYSQVHLVNLHDNFLGHGIHCAQFWSSHYDSKDPHYWYYFNLEDPNERGYDAIRRLFLLEMVKVAKQLL